MGVLIVIPARYASSRYPGKPLAMLTGADGAARSLIRRSWEAARQVRGVDRVVVATDDGRIRDAAEGFGAEVVTPVLRCDGRALNGFLEDRAEGRVGGTTAVFGQGRHALYFSKEVVPFTARRYADDEPTPVFHHVGVYAYRP